MQATTLKTLLSIASRDGGGRWEHMLLSPSGIEFFAREGVVHVRFEPATGLALAAECTVKTRALVKLQSALKRGDVRLSTDDKGLRIDLSRQSGVYHVTRESGDVMPAYQCPTGAASTSALAQVDFAPDGPVQAVLSAAGKDATRARTNGVYLASEAIATDGNRLARRPLSSPTTLERVVPRPAIEAVLRLCAATMPTSMQLDVEDKRIWISGQSDDGAWAVSCEILAEDHPPYDSIEFDVARVHTYDAADLRMLAAPFGPDALIAFYAGGLLVFDQTEPTGFNGPVWPVPLSAYGISGIGSTLEHVPSEPPSSLLAVRFARDLFAMLPKAGPVNIEFRSDGAARLWETIVMPIKVDSCWRLKWALKELEDSLSLPVALPRAEEAPPVKPRRTRKPRPAVVEAPATVAAPAEESIAAGDVEIVAVVEAAPASEPVREAIVDAPPMPEADVQEAPAEAPPASSRRVKRKRPIAIPEPLSTDGGSRARLLDLATCAPRGFVFRAPEGGTRVPRTLLASYGADFDAIATLVSRASTATIGAVYAALGQRMPREHESVVRAMLITTLLARLYPERVRRAA